MTNEKYCIKSILFFETKIRSTAFLGGWIIFIILFLSFIVLPARAGGEQTATYTVGVVPQFNVQHIHRIWMSVLEELQRRTHLRFRIEGSPSIPEFEHQLLAGKFDFAYMNPYHFLLANREKGYLPLIRDHERMLAGILVVRRDSPLKIIEDLDGGILAFPAPNALGASLLMRAELKNIYHLAINPRYVKSHDSVYMNVILGQAVAGGGVQKTFNKQPEKIRNKLRIFHRSTEVYPHPVAVHPRVSKAVRKQVREAFLEMGETETGRKLLESIPIKIIGTATTDDYRSLEKMGLEHFYVK